MFSVKRWMMGPLTPGQAMGRYNLFLYFGYGIFNPVIGVYLLWQGWKPEQVSYLLMINPLIEIVMAPIWGWTADKTKKSKQILIISAVVSACCLLLLPFAPSQSWFLSICFCLYLFASAFSPVSRGVMLTYDRQTYNRLSSYGPLGYGVGALLISGLTLLFGAVIVFPAFALILLLCAHALRLLSEEKSTEKQRNGHKFPEKARVVAGMKRFGCTLKQLFARRFWLFWLSLILITGPLQAFLTLYGVLVESGGGGIVMVGMTTFAGYLLQWFLRRTKGIWFDRWVERIQHRILYGVVFLMGLRWILMGMWPTPPIFLLAFLSQALGIALLILYFDFSLKEKAPQGQLGISIGIGYSIISLATFLSIGLSGKVTEFTGSVFFGAILLGIMTLAGWIVLILSQISTRRLRLFLKLLPLRCEAFYLRCKRRLDLHWLYILWREEEWRQARRKYWQSRLGSSWQHLAKSFAILFGKIEPD